MADLWFKVHDGNGPYLLLAHGMLSSSSQWTPNLASLSTVCRPITVELYGHNNSPAPVDKKLYEPEQYLAQFEKIRSSVGADRWFVCGYSLGAGLTMSYALTYPQRLHGHIFTNSNSAFSEPKITQAWRENAEANRNRLIEGGVAALDRIAVHPRHGKRLPTAVKEQLISDSRKHSPLGIANTMTYTSPSVSVRNTIKQNSVPALLVCGKYEKRFQVHSEFAATHMPNLQIEFVSSSHAVNMEAASEFNAAVTAFIQKHRD